MAKTELEGELLRFSSIILVALASYPSSASAGSAKHEAAPMTRSTQNGPRGGCVRWRCQSHRFETGQPQWRGKNDDDELMAEEQERRGK